MKIKMNALLIAAALMVAVWSCGTEKKANAEESQATETITEEATEVVVEEVEAVADTAAVEAEAAVEGAEVEAGEAEAAAE